MGIDADIVTRLLANAPLIALIGQRLYPVRLPKDVVLPAITFQRIATPREQAIDRTVAGSAPLFQFSVWGATFTSADAVMTALRNAILAMTGNTVSLNEVTLADERDGFWEDNDLPRRDLDVMFVHGGA